MRLLRYRLRFWVRRVTPLTWLIWALLLSDLSAPGHLKFNLIITQVDLNAFIQDGLQTEITTTFGEGYAIKR